MPNVIYGVDLSHANPDPIDLHQLVAAGSLSFIALKATEGTNWVDPTFVDRFKRILTYLPNVLLIAYHFLRTDSPAPDQMAHFYNVLKLADYFDCASTLAPAIDAERGLQGQEPSTSLVVASIGALEKLAGTKPGLYSGAAYWDEYFNDVETAYDWVARYGDAQPGIGFDIWQDSESRMIAGHAYDHNVAYMTIDQFREKCGK